MYTSEAYIKWLRRLVFCCLCCTGISGTMLAQSEGSDNFTFYVKKLTGCKSYTLEPIVIPNHNTQDVTIVRDVVGGPPKEQPAALLRLHGNIAYTFDYR